MSRGYQPYIVRVTVLKMLPVAAEGGLNVHVDVTYIDTLVLIAHLALDLNIA